MEHQKPVSKKYEAVLVTEVKVGDTLSVNTGYRPLDDEDCEVLKIKHSKGVFGDDRIGFFINSYDAGKHWYNVYIKHQYGNNPPFEQSVTRLITHTPTPPILNSKQKWMCTKGHITERKLKPDLCRICKKEETALWLSTFTEVK